MFEIDRKAIFAVLPSHGCNPALALQNTLKSFWFNTAINGRPLFPNLEVDREIILAVLPSHGYNPALKNTLTSLQAQNGMNKFQTACAIVNTEIQLTY